MRSEDKILLYLFMIMLISSLFIGMGIIAAEESIIKAGTFIGFGWWVFGVGIIMTIWAFRK